MKRMNVKHHIARPRFFFFMAWFLNRRCHAISA
ncbi:hypothetical protein T229_05655 [Tannerella sp. oral taxon BU063 isolate Cell 5]|uniref:Uncharacterized protein n=1 Tax=Tannerella sp. oral taxon BU063 isolate Cell 5 TaxID=1410950 RepID=W2CCT3_9BACT|nr:hypothetical protein T229_05655 [Tannerella sp. oral taxon BU063 isolate Cell 5]